MRYLLALTLATLACPVLADDFSATEAKIKAALKNDRRSEAETIRDKNRKPVETLKFFGLRDDMTVLELLPGGGWYTNILGPVLEESGKLYISIGASRTGEAIKGKPGFASTEVIPFDRANFTREEGARHTDIPEFSFDVRKVDMVLTFRNQHNFTAKGRANMNSAVFKALKRGGVFGVVDHTLRHMQPMTDELSRRIDPVDVIKEVQAAGFELVDYSRLHYRPDDELRYEVGRKTVTGNTDRFTLMFRKP
ncbi:MAG: methyltransferase [Gammaproteobacteria bacterium]|jgi:predicted methyltransferase|nr:methyltransferase [Gammaproteobacteria bacterium]|tara:strand:- start:992 stop:1744 length:753 start_codon:yes stop_codon:yes gene_type:complete